MTETSGNDKKYSARDLEKIRKRAQEIWKGKCQALNTALDDWLQAERELRTQIGIADKQPSQYTDLQVAKIRARAQAIREEKVRSLRTAFDDWIQAEQELKEELQKRIDLAELFDLWFGPASDGVTLLLKKDPAVQPGVLDEMLGKLYVELMTSCMN